MKGKWRKGWGANLINGDIQVEEWKEAGYENYKL